MEILLDRPLSSVVIDKEIICYKNATVNTDILRQPFTVCCSDGIEDMKADILECYKNPCTNLYARPHLRFEGKEGLGAGPLR